MLLGTEYYTLVDGVARVVVVFVCFLLVFTTLSGIICCCCFATAFCKIRIHYNKSAINLIITLPINVALN